MDSHAHDTAPLVIGSGTCNGRKATNVDNAGPANRRTPNPNRPRGKVAVYIDGVHVDDMPLGTLTRFSITAAKAFPKPDTAAANTKNSTINGQAANGDWAEAVDEKLDVGKLTAEVRNLSTTATNNNAGDKTAPQERRLELRNDVFYYQPPSTAFKYVFAWMHEAKTARRDEKPLDFGPKDVTNLSFPVLIEYYAAALILNLRPAPIRHRNNVLTKLSSSPPTVDDIKCIHERIPIDDTVMTRAVTSYFEHMEGCKYTQAELYAINDYVNGSGDPELTRRFLGIQRNRKAHAKENEQRRKENKMQRLAEGDAGVGGSNAGEVRETTAKETPADETKAEAGPSRGNGDKGVNKGESPQSKGVPGAAH